VGKRALRRTQIERSLHRRRKGVDLSRGRAYVRPRALARCQQRIRNKRFICVENRVPRNSEHACQSACRGQARSRGQLLVENRLAQLIVDLAIQRAGGLELDPQGRHGRVRGTLQSGTLPEKADLCQVPFLD